MSVVIPGQESHNSVLSVIPVTPRWVWSTPVQAEVPFIVKGDPLIQGQALPAPQYCFIFRWWSPLVAGKKDMVSFMRACLLGSLLVMFLIISLNCRPSDFCFRRTRGDCRLHPGACQQGGQALASGPCLREGLSDCGLVGVHLLHYPKLHIPNQLLVHLILPMDRDRTVAGV